MHDHESWQRIAQLQDGVVSRAQLFESGLGKADVRRLLRRRDLAHVHPGVYVTHTGPLPWVQRAWAAVLACWPAALGGASALPRPDLNGPITVVVDSRRTLRAPRGVLVVRTGRFATDLQEFSYPPKQRPAYAALQVIDGIKDDGACYAFLADVVQRRVADPAALRGAIAARSRLRRRRFLLAMIDDLETGACSVLERAYLHRVERAHGLPRPVRQAPDRAGGVRYRRDVLYPRYGLIVELDGRAFHDSAEARDRDSRRDLKTVRITHGQALGDACATARAIAALLAQGGWSGSVTSCPTCPPSKIGATS